MVQGYLVTAHDLSQQLGVLAVAGRYSSSRRLEQDLAFEDVVLGTGRSGPVRLAKRRRGFAKGRAPCAAVKSFMKRKLSQTAMAEVSSEVKVHLSLDHPNVARLEQVYETDDELHLVMEYLEGGELFDRLRHEKRFCERKAADTAYEAFLAVAYLHGQNVVHRDLKPENFMYATSDGDHLKLIDFGFARRWESGADQPMTHLYGTLEYLAPEVLTYSYSEKADIWSMGVVVYALLCGVVPWPASQAQTKKMIRAGLPNYTSERFTALTAGAQAFVKSLLCADPALRPSAGEALRDPWLLAHSLTASPQLPHVGDLLRCLWGFARASPWRRACVLMISWSLSPRECDAMRHCFHAADRDGDGEISFDDFRLALSTAEGVPAADAEVFFAGLDLNRDGKISFSEYLAAMLHTREGRGDFDENALHSAFDRFDVEQIGRISAAGVREAVGDHFDACTAEELFREACADHDDSMPFERFKASVRALCPAAQQSKPELVSALRCYRRVAAVSLDSLAQSVARRGGGRALSALDLCSLCSARGMSSLLDAYSPRKSCSPRNSESPRELVAASPIEMTRSHCDVGFSMELRSLAW